MNDVICVLCGKTIYCSETRVYTRDGVHCLVCYRKWVENPDEIVKLDE